MTHQAARYVTRSTSAAAGTIATAASSVAAAAGAACILLSPRADTSCPVHRGHADPQRAGPLNQTPPHPATTVAPKLAGRILGEA